MDMNPALVRTSNQREVRRLVRDGGTVMAEYDWRGSGVPELEARGREWVIQLPTVQLIRSAA